MGHQVGGDIATWIQNALQEERREVERLLANRHETMLQELRRQLATESTAEARERGSSDAGRLCEPELPVGLEEQKDDVNEDRSKPEAPGARRNDHASQTGLMSIVESQGIYSGSLGDRPGLQQARLLRWLSWVDIISGLAIILNIFWSALEVQYTSFDLACLVSEQSGCRPATQVWPGMGDAFRIVGVLFGLFFVVELLVRLTVFRELLHKELSWMVMDALFIAAWVVEVLEGRLGFNPTVFRMVRLIRLMRLARLIAHYKVFDPLFLIFKAVQSSMAVLVWTVVLLFVLMMAVGMLVAIMLEGFIADGDGDIVSRRLVFDSWGTFLRAYVSMFEITLANWGPQCWLLVNHVHPIWGIFFIVWRCCFGFAVIQVITSVFIQHTFKVASHDEDFMIKEKEKASKAYLEHLDSLFAGLDESGDGNISIEEFGKALREPRFRHFFAALEIDVSDVPRIFQMLDNGDGEVTKDEFIVGLKKLKGSAQAIDLFSLAKDIERLRMGLKTWDPSFSM